MKKLKLTIICLTSVLLVLGGCSRSSDDYGGTASVSMGDGVAFERAEGGAGAGDSFESPMSPEMAEPEPAAEATSESFDSTGESSTAESENTIHAGLITAGIWNDNRNHDFLLDLMQQNPVFRTFETAWQYNLSQQITTVVTDNGSPVNNARVELLDENENVLFSARTNNRGIAFLFANFVPSREGTAAYIRATAATSETLAFDAGTRFYEFNLQGQTAPESLDLMFVIDTTGSMGDELEYLKVELADIIRRVELAHANIDVRLSIIVYRDVGDDYVVRSSPFSRDTNMQAAFLSEQSANGGGDWPEAVEQALAAALDEQEWNDSATAKLMFLVLDAPPHTNNDARAEMHRTTLLAAEMGVRIVPVASSGIDTVTEFILRSLAAATGGEYVFITGHSGIGHGHIEPTIGEYEVEFLNELLIRVINSYLE